MEVKINLPMEVLDDLIIKDLKLQLEFLDDQSGPPYYSYDAEAEEKKIKKLKKALKRVLNYYGGGDQ